MVPDFYQDFMEQRLTMWGNLSMLDHLPKINGATTLDTREEFEIEQLLYGGITNDFSKVEDFLGVRYITAPGELHKWIPRTNAMPLITAGQMPVFAASADEVLARLGDPSFDPRREVLLPAEAKSLVSAKGGNGCQISNVAFGEQRISARIETHQPTLVTIAQSYYPAWKAYVNGNETPLLKANLAFQCLEVPARAHQIRLE